MLSLHHMYVKIGIIDFISFKLRLAVTKEQVITYLQNDFNTSNALLCLTDFIDEINKNLAVSNTSDSVIPSNIATISSCYMYVKRLLEILGVIVTTKKVTFYLISIIFELFFI